MEIQFVPHQLRIPWRLRLTMHAKPYYGNTETNNLKLKLRKLRALFQVLERKRRTERKRARRPRANTKTRDRFAYFGFLRDLSISPRFSFHPRFPLSFLFFSSLSSLSFPSFLSFPFSRFLRLLTFSFIRWNVTRIKEFTSNFIDAKINLYTNDGYLSIHSRFQHESLAIVNAEAKPVTSFKYLRYQQYLVETMILRLSEFYRLSRILNADSYSKYDEWNEWSSRYTKICKNLSWNLSYFRRFAFTHLSLHRSLHKLHRFESLSCLKKKMALIFLRYPFQLLTRHANL